MQKLTRDASFWVKSDRGSALMTSVVLALLMAFAGIGFITVTMGSLNNDSDAYARDRAFYAAESGALVAAKYLLSRSYSNWPSGNPHTFFSKKEINGLYVTVTLHRNAAAKQDTVKAEAFAGTVKNATTFRKRVALVIQNDEP
jgi:Tfp pilus assembly protein PilX